MVPTTPELLKSEIFKFHTIEETKQGLEKIFLNYMCSDEAEASIDRQSATVTYLLLQKLLDNL